jgi:hypothetical protein
LWGLSWHKKHNFSKQNQIFISRQGRTVRDRERMETAENGSERRSKSVRNPAPGAQDLAASSSAI